VPSETIAGEMFANELWHKVAALLLSRMDPPDQTFTERWIDEEFPKDHSIVVSHHDGGRTLRVRLLSNEEAERLAREHEGPEEPA
jgi:hypothetical protein